jgi:hypothetical protein
MVDVKQVGQIRIELMPDADVPPEKRVTRIIQRVLSETDTRNIVKKCKLENTSVHGALCAAFFQSVVEQARKSLSVSNEGPLMVDCLTAVSMRHRFIKPVEEDIGYYISLAVHSQLIDETVSLWDTARAVIKSLQKVIDSGKDIEPILAVEALLKEYPTSFDFMRVVHKANAPFVATNLGRLNIPNQFGKLTLESLHFPVSLHFDSKSGFSIQ